MSSDSPIPVFTSQQLHELKRQIDVFQEVNASVRAVLSGKEPILSMDTLKRECHVSHVDGYVCLWYCPANGARTLCLSLLPGGFLS